MANNKVQLRDGTTLIDLTQDTVTPQTLLSGATAHDAAGNPIVGTGDGGGGGTCTVTLTCEASDANLAYFSPDCVLHTGSVRAGDNVFQVLQNSPIFIWHQYNYALTNLVNIVKTDQMVYIARSPTEMRPYNVYYATASTASATQPTD